MALSRSQQLSGIARAFELYERRVDDALLNGGKLNPLRTDEELAKTLHIQKQAAACVIASPFDFIRYRDPLDIPIGLQVRKGSATNATRVGNTLECPGGALLSDQEIAENPDHPEQVSKGKFYDILFGALDAGTTDFSFTYSDVSASKARVIHDLRTTIAKEMGEEAASGIRIVRKLNHKPKTSDLATVSFGNDRNERIVTLHGAEHGLKTEKRKNGTVITGFIQRIHEDAYLGDVDDVHEVATRTTPTDEAEGMYLYTAGELLALFEYATAGDDHRERLISWEQFSVRHPKLLRPRTSSTAWQVSKLFASMSTLVQEEAASLEKKQRRRVTV